MIPKILFIHPRRGLYRITKCGVCGYLFQCNHCDAHLVTYRESKQVLSMLCHQCQRSYEYPTTCPKCGSHIIISRQGGVDELAQTLSMRFMRIPARYDKAVSTNAAADISNRIRTSSEPQLAITTRIWDPAIPYSLFTHIIFIQAENLLASPDYLVSEDINSHLMMVLQNIRDDATIIFDTNTPSASLFQAILNDVNSNVRQGSTPTSWFITMQQKELDSRRRFGFPPFKNILLLTSHHKNKQFAFDIAQEVYRELRTVKHDLVDIDIVPPYPARFLKRKDLYSYHTMVSFPRRYEHFAQLRAAITIISNRTRVQIRLNPRHLF